MAALALTACQDRGPTGPEGQLRPAFTHETLHQGPGFYFISPVPPGSQQVPGVFDDTLSPSVEIWKLFGPNGAVDGVAPVASLTATAISQHYQVSWSGLQDLARGYYRIEVRSAPSNQTHLFYGSVEVQLVDGGGSGLQVGGNSLPIKFWISTEAGCPPESVCSTVSNGAAQTLIVEEGGAALRFEENFCAKTSPTGDCLEFITVIATRYRGPERCIPDPGFRTPGNAVVPSIQYELCMRVTTIPENISFVPQKVFAFMCADLRATGDHGGPSLQNKLRIMSVEEVDSTGGPGLTGIGQAVTDLTGTATDPPDESVLDLCDHDVFEQQAAASSNPLTRFAAVAQRTLKRVGGYLSPAPLHARRANIPMVASPIGFSRLGLVLPVAAEFDRDNSIGFQNQLLPAASQPRVRVLAADTDGVKSAVPVGFVRVKFTAQDGSVSPQIDSTDTNGYVSAAWTLGTVASNPQNLKAEVGAPQPHAGVIPSFPNGEGTASEWWTSHTFTATAWQYAVHFLSPLGASGSGLTNVVFTGSSLPLVRVCGPLPSTTCTNPGTVRLRNSAYEVSWNTGKTGPVGAVYRLEVVVNGFVTGTFYAQRGGGGGGSTDPLGSLGNPYHFQTGSTIPIKFLIVVP